MERLSPAHSSDLVFSPARIPFDRVDAAEVRRSLPRWDGRNGSESAALELILSHIEDEPRLADQFNVRHVKFSDGLLVIHWQDIHGQGYLTVARPNDCVAHIVVKDRPLEKDWPFPCGVSDYRGKRVLDLCCGEGRKVLDLRRSGIDAYGVDLALPIDSASVPVYGAKSVLHFARADDLPFADGAFDLIECRWGSLYYAGERDRERVKAELAECARVLRPGGELRAAPNLSSLPDTFWESASTLGFRPHREGATFSKG